MALRIIAGSLGGRSIRIPKKTGVRPSSARLREALFSMLGGSLQGDSFLELFAGSGIIGFEAFSRGAKPVVLVESNPAVAGLLDRNRRDLGCGPDLVEVRLEEAETALTRLGAEGRTFTWIFADPPYAHPDLASLLEKIRDVGVLAPDGCFILEHAQKRSVAAPPGLELVKSRRYGDSVLAFFERSS